MFIGKVNLGKFLIIILLNCYKIVGGLLVSDVWYMGYY